MSRICSTFHMCIEIKRKRNTVCWVIYLLSIRLTVTLFCVPFVPYRQGHVDLNLNVTWLDCHIWSQLYFQPWDEQGYLSYRHGLVFLLTAIGGEALSSCSLLACCCWCLHFWTIVCKTPALTVKLPLCLVSFHVFAHFTEGLKAKGAKKKTKLWSFKAVDKRDKHSKYIMYIDSSVFFFLSPFADWIQLTWKYTK